MGLGNDFLNVLIEEMSLNSELPRNFWISLFFVTFDLSPSSVIGFLTFSWPRHYEVFSFWAARHQSGSEWAFSLIDIYLERCITMHLLSTPANIKVNLFLVSKSSSDYCLFIHKYTQKFFFFSVWALSFLRAERMAIQRASSRFLSPSPHLATPLMRKPFVSVILPLTTQSWWLQARVGTKIDC